jgi:CTP synthase (UTP-ammonia lyase)
LARGAWRARLIAAAHWARVNKRPYLGICLGLQCRFPGNYRNHRIMKLSTIDIEMLIVVVLRGYG